MIRHRLRHVAAIAGGVETRLVFARQQSSPARSLSHHLSKPEGSSDAGASEGDGNVSAVCEVGDLGKALQTLDLMHKSGMPISHIVFQSLLQTCSRRGNLNVARRVHSLMVSHGIHSLPVSEDELICVLSSFGCLMEASIVFCMIAQPNLCSWHAIISANVDNGHHLRTVELYHSMLEQRVNPDKYIYMCVLKSCSKLEALRHGQSIHDHFCRSGLDWDDYIRSALINMYSKCGSLEQACKVFECSPNRSVVLWTSMIVAYVRHEQGISAFELFKKMLDTGILPNKVTILCILKACSSLGAVEEGKLLHDKIIREKLEPDALLVNTLIDMYSKCEKIEEARGVFNNLANKTVVSWGAMIAGYVQLGHGRPALDLLEEMENKGIKASNPIYVCSLKACGITRDLRQGQFIHNDIINSGCEFIVHVGSALIDMYARCESLVEACKVFEELPERNVVSWGAIIGGLAQHGHGHFALELFERMQQEGVNPDRVISLCTLKACASICSIGHGRVLHDHIVRSGLNNDVVISNALIDMYAKCMSLGEAHKVFSELPTRTSASWSAMIAGYTGIGDSHHALKVFKEMQQQEDVMLDKFILSCITKACSSVGALRQGKQIHAQIIKNGFESDRVVWNSLIDMYARCGNLEEAHRVFGASPNPDIASWGALIRGYCQHGNLLLAGRCLKEMQRQGLKPNDMIFTSLLNACSHAGRLQEGRQIFKCMEVDPGVIPSIEYFTAMVDVFGSVGCLQEAKRCLQTMPILPDSTGWLSLLTACRMHGDMESGKQCYIQVSQWEPDFIAGHVLMSNLYADAEMWQDVHRIQELRKYVPAWKKPGMTWIEVNSNVHEFLVGDTTHPQDHKIYANLKRLEKMIKGGGYVPQLELVLGSMMEKDKESILCRHSEKLALSFGLLSTPRGTTIRVTKNLRMCTDCHSAFKIISKIERRKIILCDTHRIHVFEGELCSCGDHY